MAIFHENTLQLLQEALINMLAETVQKVHIPLTREEFIEAFISQDHVQKLDDVHSMVGEVSMDRSFAFEVHANTPASPLYPVQDGASAVKIDCTYSNGLPTLVPAYVKHGLQPTCPDALRTRIFEWAMVMDRYLLSVAIAKTMLPVLNHKCGNARALSLMFPAVSTILARVPDAGDHATKTRRKRIENLRSKGAAIMETKSIGEMPQFPRPVLALLQEASNTINSMVFLEKSPSPSIPRRGAVLRCTGVTHNGAFSNYLHDAAGVWLHS